MAGTVEILSGAVKPSSIEQKVYEGALDALRSMDVPHNLQMRMDYLSRTDGQPTYLSYGARSLATSADGWLIYKFTFDGSGFVTVRQTAYDAWDNRTTATYA